MRIAGFHRATALAVATLLAGCSLDTWMAQCADCGEIRSITARPLHHQIGLITDAPRAQYIALDGPPPVAVVYDVRIQMDRGGARDLAVSELGGLDVGDRVEIRGARIVPQIEPASPLLWL